MPITKAEPGKTRVGWIGTGVMGRWMCQHLMTKGYRATVYNRSKDKAGPLMQAGAEWADNPQKVAERADVIFAIVGFPKDVREVFLGGQGALAASRRVLRHLYWAPRTIGAHASTSADQGCAKAAGGELTGRRAGAPAP